jgi:hypothetical protein
VVQAGGKDRSENRKKCGGPKVKLEIGTTIIVLLIACIGAFGADSVGPKLVGGGDSIGSVCRSALN